MSVSTTKLDYARIRNAQRKNNKSIQGLKDATNTQTHGTFQDSHTQHLKSQPVDKDVENSSHKGAPSRNNEDFLNLFSSNFYAGNLEYINSLISNSNKSPSPISKREHSNQKFHNHKRAKSSLTESSHKMRPTQHPNDENAEPGSNSSNIQTTPNMKLGPVFSRLGKGLALKYDNTEFIRNGIMSSDKEIDYRNDANPNNTPSIKEERLFDQFFRKGALERRSMSLEDLRFEKKGVREDETNTERMIEDDNNESCGDKISGKSSLAKMEPTARGGFITSLNNYIQYFNKSNTGSQKKSNAISKKYFIDQEQKGSNYLKKELETARSETKLLKKQLEMIQNKMLEVVKINKRLMKDMNEIKLKETAYQERMSQMEDQFAHVNQRKNQYKGKLLQMQQLLELERIDNENNLVVLKRVLANNFNQGLDSRAMIYASNGRDKPQSDKDYLRGALKDLLQQKKERIAATTNPLKEKKSSTSNLPHNNRYDLQGHKKPKTIKESKKYNLSLLSQDLDLGDEIHHFTSESNNQSDSSIPYADIDNSYEPNVYTSEVYEKRVAKDQKIQYLQDKLMELMEGQESSPYLYEKTSGQKSLKKNKQKASESNLQNYHTLRERKSSFLKFNQGHLRSEIQLKNKIKSNLENSPPTNEMEDLYSSTNRSD